MNLLNRFTAAAGGLSTIEAPRDLTGAQSRHRFGLTLRGMNSRVNGCMCALGCRGPRRARAAGRGGA